MGSKTMDSIRAWCDRICERLLSSIRNADCLSEPEKRVLQELWFRSDVHTQMVGDYPGHSTLARDLGISPRRVSACLRRLQRKGFLKPVASAIGSARRPSYLLNALLLEMAYDETARSH